MRRRPRPGFAHVGVGIVPVNVDQVGMRDHLRRHICVQIEADRDRQIGSDLRPDPPKQLPFPVLGMLTDHRAVQVEIDAVDLTGRRQALQHQGTDPLERILGHMRRRRRGTPAQRMQVRTRLCQHADTAVDGNMHTDDFLEQFVADTQLRPGVAVLKLLEVRIHRRECVRLVLKTANRNPHSSPPLL